MTGRHSPPNQPLRNWRVERAAGAPELTQAGRVAIPIRLHRIGKTVIVTETVLVLTAEDAEALCGELTGLLHPGSDHEAAS